MSSEQRRNPQTLLAQARVLNARHLRPVLRMMDVRFAEQTPASRLTARHLPGDVPGTTTVEITRERGTFTAHPGEARGTWQGTEAGAEGKCQVTLLTQPGAEIRLLDHGAALPDALIDGETMLQAASEHLSDLFRHDPPDDEQTRQRRRWEWLWSGLLSTAAGLTSAPAISALEQGTALTLALTGAALICGLGLGSAALQGVIALTGSGPVPQRLQLDKHWRARVLSTRTLGEDVLTVRYQHAKFTKGSEPQWPALGAPTSQVSGPHQGQQEAQQETAPQLPLEPAQARAMFIDDSLSRLDELEAQLGGGEGAEVRQVIGRARDVAASRLAALEQQTRQARHEALLRQAQAELIYLEGAAEPDTGAGPGPEVSAEQTRSAG